METTICDLIAELKAIERENGDIPVKFGLHHKASDTTELKPLAGARVEFTDPNRSRICPEIESEDWGDGAATICTVI